MPPTHTPLWVFSQAGRTSRMANKQASDHAAPDGAQGCPLLCYLPFSSCHYQSTNSGLSCGSQLALTYMTLLTNHVSSISKIHLKPGHFLTPPLLLSCLCRHHPGACSSPSLYPTQQPERAFKKIGSSLSVQQLGLSAYTAEGSRSIPGQRTKIP